VADHDSDPDLVPAGIGARLLLTLTPFLIAALVFIGLRLARG
jgi:hypothetical protein